MAFDIYELTEEEVRTRWRTAHRGSAAEGTLVVLFELCEPTLVVDNATVCGLGGAVTDACAATGEDPSLVWDALMGSSDGVLVLAVAWSVDTPAQVLDKLARFTASEAVLDGVASNPNTRVETFIYLFDSFGADTSQSENMAENTSCDADILDRLAGSEHASMLVRLCVARNPSTAEHTVERLCDDPDSRVSTVAIERVAALRG